jgi:elongation factor P--(R)-beta-lysine ligase
MKTWELLKNDNTLWDRYFIREKVLKAIRIFFEQQSFHEVETPLLLAKPAAESYVEVFETTLLDRFRNPYKGFLSTSPEVALKKLLVAGIGNCYSLTKSFRNMETFSNTHNPEFTILEWYRVQADYKDIMNDCEQLMRMIHSYIYGDKPLIYQGKIIDIQQPWERLTMKQAFKKFANIEFDEFLNEDNAKIIASQKGYQVESHNTWEELYNQIFLNEVEPFLGKGTPTILYEFPGSMAALSKRKPDDPRYAERFEFYIEGLELGDCYSELSDPKEQENRFQEELKEIKRLGKTSYDYDKDFIHALESGLPSCSGIAVGVDRLIMLFANTTNIRDTLFFPAEELFEIEK